MLDPRADCNQIRPLLDAFHDGELEKSEAAVIDAHVMNCDGCRRALADIRLVVDSLSNLPPIVLRRDLSEQIEHRLSGRHESPDIARAELSQRSASSGAMDALSNCAEIELMLDAFHDGELTPAEHEKVSEHLGGCDKCRSSLGETKRVVISLKQLQPFQLKTDIAENFEQILAEKTKVVALRRRVAWASASAIAVAAAVLVFVFHPQSGNVPQMVASAPVGGVPQHVSPSGSANGSQLVASASRDRSQVSLSKSAPESDNYRHNGHPSAQNRVNSPEAMPQTAARSGSASSRPPEAIAQGRAGSDTYLNHTDARGVVSPLVVAERNKTADAKGNVERSGLSPVAEIADAQVRSNKQSTGGSGVALYDNESSSAEELGITTDEDGLYAIKL